jgi:predicted phosphohydrolase
MGTIAKSLFLMVTCMIHAGDFSTHGAIDEQEEFDTFLGTLPDPHKIVIAGNHDWSLEGVEYPELWFQHATYLQDSSTVIDGVKFYGAPWQPEFFNWAFNLPRGEALKKSGIKFRMIPMC